MFNQLLKDLVLVHNHGSQKRINQVSEPAREAVVLCRFLDHMKIISSFFEAFEMVGIDGSLILNILPRIGTGGSLILEFFMLQESMVLQRIAQDWLYNSVVEENEG
jgi:hypothetical protein